MSFPHKPSHLKRYRQLAEILARHGLGYFSGMLALDRFVPLHHGWLGHSRREQPYTQPEHVRLALEEMGATTTKLGQILSTRADLLPPDYLTELAKLQDAAPPVPSAQIRDVIVAELGRPIEQVFATFEDEPLAAASIGQAHAATLLDGTEVVVKVRRPGVVEQVQEDLQIFESLAEASSRRWEAAEQYDLPALTHEFAETLRSELDYIREGHSAERMAANFAGDTRVRFPHIFWDATTSRVLTMERMRGIKSNDLTAQEAAGIDRKDLAERAANVLLKMIFEDGYFHADPHPGNLFIEPDGSIAFIDFGMVGVVDETTIQRAADLVVAIAGKDPDRLTDAFLALGVARQRVDRAVLREDLQHLVSNYVDRSLGEIQLGPFLTDALTVVRRHHLQLPKNLALTLKTAIMVEGMGAQLDPDFNLMNAIQPFGERLMQERYAPMAVAQRLGQAGMEALELGTELPSQLRRLLQQLEAGNLEINFRPDKFEPLMQRFEQMVNRLVLGILAAAFIIGLSVLMLLYHPPGWQNWAGAVFGIGFFLAVGLALYLAWSIAHPRQD